MTFVEENSLYRRFTRVWHIVAAVATLALAYNLTSQDAKNSGEVSMFEYCLYYNMAFILSWGINTGMTMWVSFVAGLVMIKNMDRHTFGYIQSKLFPIYFIIQGLTSLVQLVVFLIAKNHITSFSMHETAIICSIIAGLLCGVLNGIWLGPVSSKFSFKRMAMEKEEGVIAPNLNAKLREDPTYQSYNKQFGKYHGISVLLNLFSLSGNMYILYFMSLELIKNSRLAA